MKVWILYMFISSGFGSSATGGATVIDGFTTPDKCEFAQHRFERQLGSKLDESFCIEVEK